jgi:hypothetical protein
MIKMGIIAGARASHQRRRRRKAMRSRRQRNNGAAMKKPRSERNFPPSIAGKRSVKDIEPIHATIASKTETIGLDASQMWWRVIQPNSVILPRTLHGGVQG